MAERTRALFVIMVIWADSGHEATAYGPFRSRERAEGIAARWNKLDGKAFESAPDAGVTIWVQEVFPARTSDFRARLEIEIEQLG